ncbi:ABC transporter ATP-binding protein [Spelaeicoccus albus]
MAQHDAALHASMGGESTSGVPAIELKGVTKDFTTRHGTVQAVEEIDLSIRQGEFFSLLGPSGCGKTTTLRMIAGFEEPSRGTILLYGNDVTRTPSNKRDVNMVFQSYALFPHMNVFENVAFGLRRKKLPEAEITTRVGDLITLVDMAGKENRKPKELSGGQQQRVALARALVNRPRALLLDEPLSALDLKLRQAMQLELKRIQREIGITFIYVTHDQGEALTMSDRMVVMSDGRIQQLGNPREIYEEPSNRFVAGFIGTSNILTGTIERIDGDIAVIGASSDERLQVRLRGQAAIGNMLEFSVRPEKMTVASTPSDAGCTVRGTVKEVVYLGTSTHYIVTTSPGADVTVYSQNTALAHDRFATGDGVWLSWSADHSYQLAGNDAGDGSTDQ